MKVRNPNNSFLLLFLVAVNNICFFFLLVSHQNQNASLLREVHDLKLQLSLVKIPIIATAAVPMNQAGNNFQYLQLVLSVIIVGASLYSLYSINTAVNENFFVKFYVLVNKRANEWVNSGVQTQESNNNVIANSPIENVTPVVEIADNIHLIPSSEDSFLNQAISLFFL